MILFPVAVLTAVGLLSLRQDRLLAEEEARERAGRIAQALADRVFGLLSGNDRSVPSDAALDRGIELDRPVFEVTALGDLDWPGRVDSPPSPRPLDGSLLAPTVRALWELALDASRAGDAAGVARAWSLFLEAEPPTEFAARAQYELAQAETRLGQTSQALSRWGQLATADTELALDSGLPLAPLAAWKAAELELALSPAADRRGILLHQACSNLVFRATALSPELLRRVEALAELVPHERGGASPSVPPDARELRGPGFGPGSMRAWWQLWETTQCARGLFVAARREWERRGLLATNRPGEGGAEARLSLPPVWVEVPDPGAVPGSAPGGGSWLVARYPPSGLRFRGWAEHEVTNLIARVRGELPESPRYLQVSFSVAGRPFPAVPALPLLAERFAGGMAEGGGVEPGLSVRVHLADAAALYAQQQRRTWWFLAVVLAAAATAGVGLLSAYRAFQRQLRLNAMKSSFVSSVSHELRTPIASVRLLAESLDRGRITDEAKRRDYFRLIGQECRRLSALVENVLDFSRMDQGRKQYEFEPTDLIALVTQTVELMEPYAAERQVALVLVPGAALGAQPSLDGKAIQQALVNLIDNAVKHAPAGSAVTVALSTPPPQEAHGGSVAPTAAGRPGQRGSRIVLSVADQGPGIPPGEHARIFEPFYRRGSELRRETAGVGIGLSIVRHVVEAHGGVVRVESDVGKGSRFVIELPAPAGPAGPDTEDHHPR